MQEDGAKLENNNTAFTNFAFDTHVDAYVNAGVLKLSIMDKLTILLTPKAEDLLSDRGLKQVSDIGVLQAMYYVLNPFFFGAQMAELAMRAPKITEMVEQYVKDNQAYFDKLQQASNDPSKKLIPEQVIMTKIIHTLFPSFSW